jgi:H+/Cl- antiporter ClcA
MGFVAFSFLSCIDQIPKQWATCNYDVDRNCGNWYTGEKYWIAISGGGGLVVGLIRYLSSYPDNLPGIFRELNNHRVHPDWAPFTFLLSIVSISCGATLGPEMVSEPITTPVLFFYVMYSPS